jgi:hypothetical protein
MEEEFARISALERKCKLELSRLAKSGGEQWGEMSDALRQAESLGLHFCERTYHIENCG